METDFKVRQLVIALYVVIIRSPMTFFSNIVYWVAHIKDLSKAVRQKKRLRSYAQYFYGVISTMKEYKWKSDPLGGAIDWSPWPLTIINKNEQDDCDGAARLGRWMCKFSKDVEFANEYILVDGWDVRSAHVVCIGRLKDSMKWFCFNVSQLLEATSFESILDQFVTDELTSHGKYKNLVYYKLK